jgi:hydroxyacyl-ACP dehydratase HTD2-like protein with hotdog domain
VSGGSGPIDVADLGLALESETLLDTAHAARFAVAVGSSERPAEGDPLPFLWHWGWFGPVVGSDGLGDDGHPRLTSPVLAEYPRRMWASGSLREVTPFVVGRAAIRRSAVESLAEKTGRSGAMLIVDVAHRYEQDGREVLTEQQTLIYRAAGGLTDLPTGDFVPSPSEGEWHETVQLGPVDLFRFSAVTFNSHRIHYDWPYAANVEGYPALVVHAPLTVVRLAGSAHRATGRRLGTVRFRALASLFADVPFTILGRTDGTRATVSAIRNDGTTAMTAELSEGHLREVNVSQSPSPSMRHGGSGS